MFNCGKTCFGTGGCLFSVNNDVVTKIFYKLLRFNDFSAFYTLLTCSKTCLGTSSCLCGSDILGLGVSARRTLVRASVTDEILMIVIIMTKRGNNVLLNVVAIASCTVVTLSKTVFSTGRSQRCKDLYVVTKGGNDILAFLMVTSCTMSAFSKTVIITVRLNRCVSYHIVTKSGHGFLSYGVITSGAALTCGKTAFGTSGSNSLFNYKSVTKRGNGLLSLGCLTANGALLTYGKTAFGTGSFLTGDLHLGVTKGGSCFGIAIATSTGEGGSTLSYTSGSCIRRGINMLVRSRSKRKSSSDDYQY
jgi:hypothetical protein